MIASEPFELFNSKGEVVSAKAKAFEDVQNMFKCTIKRGVTKVLPLGHKDRVHKEGQEVFFYGFPKKIWKAWKPWASTMLVVHDGTLSTSFRKKLGDDKQLFDHAFRLVREIEDYLFEIKLVERNSFKEWLEGIQSGEPRGYFNPYMYLARLLLYDKSYYPKPANYRKFPLLPFQIMPVAKSISRVQAGNPSANVGFPYLRPWNKKKLSDEENEGNKEEVRSHSQQWIKTARSMSKKPNFPTALQGISPYNAVFFRAQSRGRPVVGVSKVIALQEMRISQGIEASINACVWNATGDRLLRLMRMNKVLNGSVGSAIADGDDAAVKAGDGIVSMDASAFDTSVQLFELMLWMKTVKRALVKRIRKRVYNIYQCCILASMVVHNAANVGMVILPHERGLRSGCPSTHQIGTAVEYARMINCDWQEALVGISQMNRLGFYRPEKQFILQDTITLSQLVVSKKRPNKIHGIMARAARALLEREDRESSGLAIDKKRFNEIEDTRIVSICANLYGHPKFKEFVTWVAEHWDIRISYQRMVKLVCDLQTSLIKNPKNSSGRIEREALKSTWHIFYTTKASS